MKTKIFNVYVDKVCYLFGIEKEMLFTKTKRRDVVDARQLLYYLCSERPMRLVYIQEYMAENGYDINHSSIHHGIAQVKEKLLTDKDYIETLESITDEA
jgi:chromosomal replication initiation ATPase DnaA